jgi:ATP-dependent DNA helicase MPH1
VNKYFRILALSASPGSDIKHIQQVIDNLLIERMEVRTDDDPDVRKYIQHTDIETIVLPLSSQMIQVKNQFMAFLREPLEKLVKTGAFFQSNPERVSHGMLIATREEWR